VRAEADASTQKLQDRATNIYWQLSSGPLRSESVYDCKLLYETFVPFGDEPDSEEDVIYLPLEGYHRSIYIRNSKIDYISLPKRKYNEGSIESAEDELDGDEQKLMPPKLVSTDD